MLLSRGCQDLWVQVLGRAELCACHVGAVAPTLLLLVERQCLLELDSGAMLPAACVPCWLCDLVRQLTSWRLSCLISIIVITMAPTSVFVAKVNELCVNGYCRHSLCP